MPDYPMTLTRSRVKNLTINEYCELCKKPKSWNGTLMMGTALEEGTQEVPETCMCQFNAAACLPIPNALPIQSVDNPMTVNGYNGYAYGVNATSAIINHATTHIMVSKQQYTAIIAENEQLRARIAELEKRAIHNAVDDLFLPDGDELFPEE